MGEFPLFHSDFLILTSLTMALVPEQLSTEKALLLFGISLGATGALAQFAASQRLEQSPTGTVSLKSMTLPIAAAAGATVVATQLVPKTPPTTTTA